MHAVVRDMPASWEEYGRLAAVVGNELPAGLVLTVAGRTAEGVRVIEVWLSRSALEVYERDRLAPALSRADLALGTATVRELAVERSFGPGIRQLTPSPAEPESPVGFSLPAE